MSLLTDSSNNNLRLNKFGNTVINRSMFKYGGGSVYFDGTSDYLTAPQIPFGTGDFTIEMWVFLISRVSAYPTLFGNYNVFGAESISLQAGHANSPNKYNVWLQGLSPAIESLNNIKYQKWTHVAVTRQGNIFRLFIDGNLDGSRTFTGSLNGVGSFISIGAPLDSTSTSINGYIDDYRITKNVARYTGNFTPPTSELTLTSDPHASNVSLLMNFNPIVDSSRNNFVPTENGNVQVDVLTKKYGNGALYFDGSGDYLSVPSNAAFAFETGDFTVEFWVNPNASSSQQFARLIQCGTYPNGWQLVRGTAGADNGTSNPIQLMLDFSGGSPRFQGGIINNNVWSHVAVTRSSGFVRIFVNGVLATSGTGTNNLGQFPLIIGGNGSGGESFAGYIDDLRITKGVARYGGFTVPTSAFDSDANTLLLLHFDEVTFKDKSNNNFALTRNGNVKISSAVHKYGGGSAQFDGSGDYLTTPYNTAFAFGTGDYTVECWINPSTISGIIGFYATNGGSGQTYKLVFHIENGIPKVHINNPSNIDLYNNATSAISQNTWTHIAYVRNGTTWTWYINGVASGTGTNSTNLTFAGNELTYVGNGGETYFNNLNGYIDDLRITKGVARYTSNFTPPTQQLPSNSVDDPNFNNVSLLLDFNPAPIIDSSSNNFTITQFGDVSVDAGIKQFGAGAAYFDGTGDYLQTTISNTNWTPGVGGQPFTIELWAYFLSVSGTKLLIAKHGGTNAWNSTTGLNFNFYYTGTELIFGFNNGGSEVAIKNAVTLSANQWTHFAVVYDGTRTRIFVNGNTLPVTSTTSYSSLTSANIVEIGSQINGSYPFNGYIDELRVTKGLARYTGNFTPPTEQLPPVGDTQLENVSLLLKGDGTNNSPEFRDFSKHNHVLTTFGNTKINTSVKKFGTGAIRFDGSGDHLKLPASESLALGTGNFTIEMWVYLLSNAQFAYVDMNPVGTGGQRPNGFCWYIETYLMMRFYINGNNIINTASNIVPLNQWYHAALVRNNGVTTIYLNGNSVGSTSVSYNASNASGALIGTFCDASSLSPNGYFDEIRITKGIARYTSNFVPHTAPFSSYALTPFAGNTLSDQLFAFWKLDNEKDSSNNRNNLVNTGNVQFIAGKIGNCATFNKSNDLRTFYLSPAFDAARDFSVSFWLKGDPLNSGAIIVGGDRFWIYSSISGMIQFSDFTSNVVQIPNAIVANTWRHYVFIKAAGRTKVYINAAEVYNQTTVGTFSGTTTTFSIGRQTNNNWAYEGSIEAVGIWQRELTLSEIAALYNSGNGLEP